MILFNSIFETFNKYKNNIELSFFFNKFSKDSFFNEKYNKYTWKKQIHYKFFILENFYFHYNIDNHNKDKILELFYLTQKRLFALYKFKHLFIHKFKKYKGQQIDLNFNELQEQDKNNLILIHNNNKLLFNVFDLIKIICSSLSYDCSFFSEPKMIKNPWDNSSFSLSNLYNIYFFVKNSTIEMPILLLRFFQSSFCLDKFKDENQFIIKQYIISNYNNFDNNKKHNYIKKMFEFYNNLVLQNQRITIDNLFPKDKLIPIFEKYLKTFLLAKFSYESDIRIKNKNLLKKKLKDFKVKQPLFGRKIVCPLHIKKLYCISELKYKYNYFFFTNLYIPPKDLIFLNHKSFFIEYNYDYDNKYSLFPCFDSNETNYNIVKPFNISNLTGYIKSIVFTEEQNKIIESEFTPIFNNIVYENNNDNCLCERENIMNISSFLELISSLDDNNNQNQTITNFQFNNISNNNIVSDDDDEDEDEEERFIQNLNNSEIQDYDSENDSDVSISTTNSII